MKPEMPLQSFNYAPRLVSDEIADNKNIEKNIDSGVGKDAERHEHYNDNNSNSVITNDVISTTMLPTPVVGSRNDDIATTIVSAPLVANDDDLIEKEWVNKAKKIIADTHNNPYQRERAVSELQVVYLKKRYGKELGIAK